MAKRRAERQIVIEGTPHECFDALTDYESFSEWQRAVKSAEVLGRDADGRGKRVAFEIDAKLRTVRYVLEYRYEAPHHVSWHYVEGDVKDVDGEFVLEDRGDNTTLATYALRIDPGGWLPRSVAGMLDELVMQGAMEDLKRRVEERRAA